MFNADNEMFIYQETDRRKHQFFIRTEEKLREMMEEHEKENGPTSMSTHRGEHPVFNVQTALDLVKAGHRVEAGSYEFVKIIWEEDDQGQAAKECSTCGAWHT